MYKKVLVPLDGSKVAEEILPYVRLIARGLEIPVELLGIVDAGSLHAYSFIQKKQKIDELLAVERRRSETYLKNIGASLAGIKSEFSVETGKPEEVIIGKAGSDMGILIAMATHGRSGIQGWLLGSVVNKVVQTAANPVLLVRANAATKGAGEATLTSVIVPLDGSKAGEIILPTVIDLAKSINLEVILLRVYHLPSTAYYRSEDYPESQAYLPTYEELTAALSEEARSYLNQQVETIRGEGIEKISGMLLEGSAAAEIISLARKTPGVFIAMTTHGRSGVKRLMLGSVTEKVVRHAENPVLILRPA